LVRPRQARTSSTGAPPTARDWTPLTRLVFRFAFVYVGLYAVSTPVLGGTFPGVPIPALGTVWPMREATLWCAEQIFGVTAPLVYTGNSGDTAFHWVQTWLLLSVAIAVTVVWSLLDRRRGHYITQHAWLRFYIRFGLAGQMFYFGMAKVIPTQFQAPSLATLVGPVGHLSLTDLLWTFIGASTPYQIFTGCAEVLAGMLLVVPRTTMLGALVAAADMAQVFALNLTYDVGLKQISFHLLLLSLVLLAPDLRRLANLFLLDRSVGPSSHPPLWRTPRANRIALVAQAAFGVYLMAMFWSLSLGQWHAGGDGRARSALYGIWDVEQLSIDGEARSPAVNDYDRRWRRVIFDLPNVIVFQRTDDSFAHYGASIEADLRSLVLTKGNSRTWTAGFRIDQTAEGRMTLDGTMDGYQIRVMLRRVELDTFRLRGSDFRWIRPPEAFGG
jgi:hypothetical protein